LMHALRSSSGEGHTLQYQSELFAAASELIGVALGENVLPRALEDLAATREVKVEADATGAETAVYLPWLAASESGVAASVEAMLARAGSTSALAGETDLHTIEDLEGVQMDLKQREAVLGLLR